MHDVMPKVVAIAVRMVMMMLRTLPQVELLLNVPIVVRTPPRTLPQGEGVYSTRGMRILLKG
jgi:hypothetical protein